jgi:hypothetical protein
VEIKLQGLGEPTMQRDDYFAMIRYAREKHLGAHHHQHLAELHLKDNYRKMIDADVKSCRSRSTAPVKRFTRAFAAAPIMSASWRISC